MCLILFAVAPTQDCQLLVAANRDEQHGRATARADFWQDAPDVLAGRDLVAGGTWLGITRSGRFAAVTNFAEPPPEPLPPLSRGELTADFLQSNVDIECYLEKVAGKQQQYRGFNLLLSDNHKVCYFSNRSAGIKTLEPGFYGLSNQLLNCNWAKVVAGKQELQSVFNRSNSDELLTSNLFQLLAQRDASADQVDPHNDKFILGQQYGTGVSTVVIQRPGQTLFATKGFAPDGSETYHQTFTL